MPLQFDPASILAPGGIASGLDDMGAAVVNAMNRRAERKYAQEAEARRRGFQVEDRDAGFGQQRLMQERGFGHANTNREDEQTFRSEAEEKAQIARLLEEARKAEAALEPEMLADPRATKKKTGRKIKGYDDTLGMDVLVDEMRDLTPGEIEAVIAERAQRISGLENRYENQGISLGRRFGEVSPSWRTARKEAAAATPAPKKLVGFNDAVRSILTDPTIKEAQRSLEFSADPMDAMAEWRTFTGTGDSPRVDWFAGLQAEKNDAGTIKMTSKRGRAEVAAYVANAVQALEGKMDPAEHARLKELLVGKYAATALGVTPGSGEMFRLPGQAPVNLKVNSGQGTASTSTDGKPPSPAKAQVDARLQTAAPEVRQLIEKARQKGLPEEQILAALPAE